jgi:hypothetical protein
MGLGARPNRRRDLHSRSLVVVMITHEDSLMIAKTLAKARINRDVAGPEQFKAITAAMANALEDHNPHFSRDIFFSAMMGYALST